MSAPFRPVQYYAPSSAALADIVIAISQDLMAVRDLLMPMLDAPTRERLRNAEPGQWRQALSGLSDAPD